MPTAGAIRAGRAFVEIFADDSKLQRGLHAAQSKLKAFASSSMAIGGAMIAGATAAAMPLLGAVRQFMSVGDALDEMSSRMGVSVEFLSVLSHAASLSGTSIEALEVGVRKMQKTAYDAANGSKTAEEAFAALGISATDANGDLKGTESLFMETTTALGNVANETEKAALAVALFGRSGTSLLPMLGSGAEGMRAMMEEAQRLGLVMSTRDAKAAAELADAWQGVTSSLKFATLQIGAALAPVLTALATQTTELLTPVIAWVRGNQWLVVSIAGVIAGIGALGATLVVVSESRWMTSLLVTDLRSRRTSRRA